MSDNNKNVGIYCWTNKVNGKKYVGQSSNLRKRRNTFLYFHLRYGGRRIDSARKSYNSPEYWEYEVLEYCTPEELNEKEEQYIYLLNTLNPDLGYNLTIGGDGARGAKCSEEVKEYLRNLYKGKPLSEEHRKKISESLKGKYVGEKNANYGKPLSEERKRKLIECNKRKVKQLDKETLEVIKIWDSASDFEKEFGLNAGDISQCCVGKKRTAHGFKWCYAENEVPPEYLGRSNDKIILQYDLDGNFIMEWKSIKEAAESLNISVGCISGCLSGSQNTGGSYIWKLKNPEDLHRSESSKCKKILQYDLEGNLIKIWNNRRDIFGELNISTDAIKRCLYGKSNSSHNFIWRYEDDDSEVMPYVKLPTYRKDVYQIDIETDEILNEFISTAEAERITGIDQKKISSCCRGEQRSAEGFKWQYKDNPMPFIEKERTIETLKVCQISKYSDDVIKLWDSVVEAANELGITKENIYACCRGKVKTAGGFRWCYEGEPIPHFKEKVTYKPIYQIDKKSDKIIREWVNVSQIKEELGYNTKCVTRCCRGERTIAYGFKWRYKEDYDKEDK